MRPIATIHTIFRRVGTVAPRLLAPALRGRGSLPVLAAAVVLALGTQGYLVFQPVLTDNGELTGAPVPAGELQTIQSAALSCPALTGPELAGQLMAASGFDSAATSTDGVRGLAKLSPASWTKWQPWADAQRTDPQANILALAHETCEMVGEMRAAGLTGDPWRTAVAAIQAGPQAVLGVKGIPASAQPYVDTVSGYADWYARQPEFGGLGNASASPTGGVAAAAAVGATPVPQQYVADVLKAGRICTAVTPARVAAQLMAASGFDPNKQSASGAEGIAQFQPEVWSAYASSAPASASPWDPDSAIPLLGTTMCSLSGQLSALTSGDPYTLGLAAFQWNTTAVREAGGVPESPTLQADTDQVLSYVDYYSKDPRLNPAAASAAPKASKSAAAPKAKKPPKAKKSPQPKAAAPTRPAIDTSGLYQIKNNFNGMVVDVPGNDDNMSDGTTFDLWQDQRAKDQFFRLVPDGSTGYYQIIDANSGKALSVNNRSKDNGSSIVQTDPDTSDLAQLWRFDDAGDGTYWIVDRNSGSVLDVLGDDNDTANGATIDQWSLQTYAKDQRWLLTR